MMIEIAFECRELNNFNGMLEVRRAPMISFVVLRRSRLGISSFLSLGTTSGPDRTTKDRSVETQKDVGRSEQKAG